LPTESLGPLELFPSQGITVIPQLNVFALLEEGETLAKVIKIVRRKAIMVQFKEAQSFDVFFQR
jgi:hypothetical protein